MRVIAAPPLFDVESTNVPVFEVELQSNVQFAMARDGNVVDAMAASPVPDRLTNGPLDEPLMVDDAAADELQAAASRAIPMRSAQDGTRFWFRHGHDPLSWVNTVSWVKTVC